MKAVCCIEGRTSFTYWRKHVPWLQLTVTHQSFTGAILTFEPSQGAWSGCTQITLMTEACLQINTRCRHNTWIHFHGGGTSSTERKPHVVPSSHMCSSVGFTWAIFNIEKWRVWVKAWASWRATRWEGAQRQRFVRCQQNAGRSFHACQEELRAILRRWWQTRGQGARGRVQTNPCFVVTVAVVVLSSVLPYTQYNIIIMNTSNS